MQNQNENKNIVIDESLKKLGESLEDGIKEVANLEKYTQLKNFFNDLVKYINDETQELSAPDFIFEKAAQGDEEASEAEEKYLESVEALKAEMKRLKVQLNVIDNEKAVEVSVDGKPFLKSPISVFIAILVGGIRGLFNFFNGILRITSDLNKKENKIKNRISQANKQIREFIYDCSAEGFASAYAEKSHINESLDGLGEILEPAVKEAVDEDQRKELEFFFGNCIDYVEGKTEDINIPEFLVDSDTISNGFGFNLGNYARRIRKALDKLKNKLGENSMYVSKVRDKIIRSIVGFSEEMLGQKDSDLKQNRDGEKFDDVSTNTSTEISENDVVDSDLGNVRGNKVSEIDDNQSNLESFEKQITEGNSGVDIENVVEGTKVNDHITKPPTPTKGWSDLKQNRDGKNFDDVSTNTSTEIFENDVVDSDLGDVGGNKASEIDDNQSNLESSEKQITEENSGANIENQVQNVVEETKVNDHIPKPPTPPEGWEKFGAFLENNSKDDKQNSNQTIPKPPEPQKIDNSNSSPILSPEEKAINSIRSMFRINEKVTLNAKDLNGAVEYHKDKIKDLNKKIKDLEAKKEGIKNGTGGENFLQNALSVAIKNRRQDLNEEPTSTKDKTVGLIDGAKRYIENLRGLLTEFSELGEDLSPYEDLRKQVDESEKSLNSLADAVLTDAVPTDKEFGLYDDPEDDFYDFYFEDEDKKRMAIEKVKLFVNKFAESGIEGKINEITEGLDKNKNLVENIRNRINEAKQQEEIKKIQKQIDNLNLNIKKEERVLEIFDRAKAENIDIEYIKNPNKLKEKANQQEKNKNDVGLKQDQNKIEEPAAEKGPASDRGDLQTDLSKEIAKRGRNLHMHDDENYDDDEEDDWDKDAEIKPLNLNIEKEDKKSLSGVNENPKIQDEAVETKKENKTSDFKDEEQKSLYDIDKNPETLDKIKETMKENKSNGLDVINEVDESLEGELEEENENNKLEDKNSSVITKKTDLDSPKLNKEAEKYISKTDKDTIKTTRLSSAAEEYLSNNGINLDIEEQIKMNAIKSKYLELAKEGKSHTESIKSDTSNREVEKQNGVDDKKTLGLKRSKTFDKKVNTENDDKNKNLSPLKKLKTLSPKMRAFVDIYENGNNNKDDKNNVQPHKLALSIAKFVKNENEEGLISLQNDINIYANSKISPDVKVIKAADKYLKERGENNKKALKEAIEDPNFKFDEKEQKKENRAR